MEEGKYQLTKEGKLELEKELENLIHVERTANITQLQDARAQGDLSENADYDAARDNQAKIESRIAEIEHILANCEVVAEKKGAKTVQIGSKVVIYDLTDDSTTEYSIVSTVESKISENKISNVCPLGAAVLGKKVGEIAKVKVKDGDPYDVKIVEIK